MSHVTKFTLVNTRKIKFTVIGSLEGSIRQYNAQLTLKKSNNLRKKGTGKTPIKSNWSNLLPVFLCSEEKFDVPNVSKTSDQWSVTKGQHYVIRDI